MKTNLFLILIITFCSGSCALLKKSSKTEFTDAFYIQHTDSSHSKVYVDIADDDLRVHKTVANTHLADTSLAPLIFPVVLKDNTPMLTTFGRHTFDADVLTIPLKYRPARKGMAPQLNTNLNGALYLGYRTDLYRVNYEKSPLGKAQRNVNHFGFSVGLFTGAGNTAINTYTTANPAMPDYDGIVWSRGIAGIIAVNRFTVGISAGYDYLLDRNRKDWMYQNKIWYGLAFGLNLN
jgi:hypothetical protein